MTDKRLEEMEERMDQAEAGLYAALFTARHELGVVWTTEIVEDFLDIETEIKDGPNTRD